MLIPAKALAFTPDSSLMKDYQIVGKVSRKGRRVKPAGGAHGGSPSANQVSHTAKSRNDTSGVTKQRAIRMGVAGQKTGAKAN